MTKDEELLEIYLIEYQDAVQFEDWPRALKAYELLNNLRIDLRQE